MESVGAFLKSAREEKSATLEEMSEKTFLKERILESIENDQFDELGGIGYARAMVCTYCKALDVNQAEALRLLSLKSQFTPKRVIAESDTETKPLVLPSNIFGILLLIIVVIVLGFIVWGYYKDGKLGSPIQNNVKPKVETKVSVEEPLPTITMDQKEPKKEVVVADISTSALYDTTDYVNDYLFQGKKNPLNIKVN